jgi:hypothetical protein
LAELAALLPILPVSAAGGASAAKPIHPGVHVTFGDVTCTVAAVMRQGGSVYLVIPASCGGIDEGKVQDGCDEAESPLGTPVQVDGAKYPGTYVYNSFSEMQLHGDTNSDQCYYNDLALVRLDPRDRSRVSATIPGTAAPAGVARRLPASGAALKIASNAATAGATHNDGWEVDVTAQTAMFSASDVGSAVTSGNVLVGMLIVLPGGLPAPAVQTPAEVYNMARSIQLMRRAPGFHGVRLVTAGGRV